VPDRHGSLRRRASSQSQGHDARLIPTRYVRPYSKGQKNDFRDSEAIAEAVAGGLHDLGSAATVGRQKDAPCPPNVLLRTIAVGDHSFELATVRSAQLDVRSLLHPSDSHTPVPRAANRSVGFGPLVSQAISKCIPAAQLVVLQNVNHDDGPSRAFTGAVFEFLSRRWAGWLASTGRELNPLDRYKRFQITFSSPFSGFILAQRTAGFPSTAGRLAFQAVPS
jgi:hypothetical protein